MAQQSLGVVGGGVLGWAVARGFMEHCQVKVYDVIPERLTHPLHEAATCDIVFVCLPTPSLPDGRCDTSLIDAFLEEAADREWWGERSCYVLRSTTPVGYTQQQAAKREFSRPLLHSPEFLTARVSLTDFQTPARNIVGHPTPVGGWSNLESDYEHQHREMFVRAADTLEDLYVRRFPGVAVHEMDSNASELVKLACNSFFAAKVTLFNLFYDLAKARGIDWDDVRGGILSDGRIAHAHTLVPGPDLLPGFGGACSAKDTADLYHCCREAGVDAKVLREVLERNARARQHLDPSLAKIALPVEQ